MAYVTRIDAPSQCPDCTAIRSLCLSTGVKLSREDAYWRVKGGETIRSGSEFGPRLEARERGTTRYVRTASNDRPDDNLLELPRGC